MAHTPAPWSVRLSPQSIVYDEVRDAYGELVAEVHTWGQPDSVADNCRLIAAAPDLLKSIVALLEASDWYGTEEFEQRWRKAVKKARKVCHAAGGGQ